MFRTGDVPWNKGNTSTTTVLCFGCGQLFERACSEVQRGKGRSYCSMECYRKNPKFKLCVGCDEVLPINEFGKQGVSKLTGRQYYVPRCKACDAPRKYMQQEKRRAQKIGVGCDYTHEQWASALEVFGWRCAYCNSFIEEPCQDHFMPLSLGGLHTAKNVLPSCRSCNSSKNNTPPQEWLGPAKFCQLSAVLSSLG